VTTTLRYTSADGNVTVSGNTFVSVGAPGLKRGPTKLQIGVEVDTLEITFLVNAGIEINGMPLAQFAQQGGFDGARIKLERVFMGTWGDTSAGSLVNFVGRVADVECTRTEVRLIINSDLELLNIALPRNIYQAGCIHSLYDNGCALQSAAFTANGAVTSGSTVSSINCNLAAGAAYYELGTISFTSGANTGLTRAVKSYTTGNVVPSIPLPEAPVAGDLFVIKPGCDKLADTCDTKFANLGNFRGYPTIPVPETSY